MQEHLTETILARWRAASLAPEELLRLHRHTAACEPCRRRLQAAPEPWEGPEAREHDPGLRLARALAAPVEDDGHLDTTAMSDLLTGAGDETDRELAASHLDLCAACRDEYHELRAFHAALGALPAREFSPTPRPHPIAAFPFLRFPAGTPRLQLAVGAAMAALVVYLAGVLPARREEHRAAFRAAEAARKLGELQQARARETRAREAQERQLQAQARETRELAGQTAALLQKVRRLERERQLAASRLPAAPAGAGLPGGLASGVAPLVSGGSPVLGPQARKSLDLLSPVGTAVVDERPEFRWRAVPGATGYELVVLDPASGEVVARGTLPAAPREPVWKPAAPLPFGRVLRWRARALRGAKTLDEAPHASDPAPLFEILPAAQARTFRHASAPLLLQLGDACYRAGGT